VCGIVRAASSVRHRPCGVGDDVGVAGVGLALAGVQVGQAAHRQAGQVADVDAAVAGDRDGQRLVVHALSGDAPA
jgi:hypothetical protein